MKTCDTCKHFWYQSPQRDQPYPEFACMKGHWDGTDDPDSLNEEIDCKDFNPSTQQR